jgi:hypothetical protein
MRKTYAMLNRIFVSPNNFVNSDQWMASPILWSKYTNKERNVTPKAFKTISAWTSLEEDYILTWGSVLKPV